MMVFSQYTGTMFQNMERSKVTPSTRMFLQLTGPKNTGMNMSAPLLPSNTLSASGTRHIESLIPLSMRRVSSQSYSGAMSFPPPVTAMFSAPLA